MLSRSLPWVPNHRTTIRKVRQGLALRFDLDKKALRSTKQYLMKEVAAEAVEAIEGDQGHSKDETNGSKCGPSERSDQKAINAKVEAEVRSASAYWRGDKALKIVPTFPVCSALKKNSAH